MTKGKYSKNQKIEFDKTLGERYKSCNKKLVELSDYFVAFQSYHNDAIDKLSKIKLNDMNSKSLIKTRFIEQSLSPYLHLYSCLLDEYNYLVVYNEELPDQNIKRSYQTTASEANNFEYLEFVESKQTKKLPTNFSDVTENLMGECLLNSQILFENRQVFILPVGFVKDYITAVELKFQVTVKIDNDTSS